MKDIDFDRTPVVPMHRDRLYEQVAQQIQGLIVTSGWPAGSKIPAERELGDRFGVSRTVVREALKALAERGLVAIQPGRGIFVARMSGDALKEPMKLLFQRRNFSCENLVETRRVLEVEIAGFAAERAEPEELQKMRAAIDEMEATIGDVESFVRVDHAFHVALAEATKNPLLPMLIDSIGELVQETRMVAVGVSGSQNRGQFYHRKLVDAVERRDASAARLAMSEHLDQFDADIQAARRLSA